MSPETLEFVTVPLAEWIGLKAELGQVRLEFHKLQSILHQLGMDHERLSFRFAGRDFRLTDVHGRVVREVVG